jgi:hypothetical protein
VVEFVHLSVYSIWTAHWLQNAVDLEKALLERASCAVEEEEEEEEEEGEEERCTVRLTSVTDCGS